MSKYFKVYLPFLLIFGSLLVLLSGCRTEESSNAGSQERLIIENPFDAPVANLRVTIPRTFLAEKEKAHPGAFPQLIYQDRLVIPVQYDDLDGDGEWDELVSVFSLAPLEKAELELEWVNAEGLQDFAFRTQAYFGLQIVDGKPPVEVGKVKRFRGQEPGSEPALYQFEGPGWENENLAFRIYFDQRNGKDIFGKRRKGVFLDSIGVQYGDSVSLEHDYHSLQEWGMDILKVGNSLGAGGLALESNGNIYRLADADSTFFQLIGSGPIRSIIELNYHGWDIEGQKYKLTERISIWAGSWGYQSEVTMDPIPPDSRFVVGMVNLKDPAMIRPMNFEDKVIAVSHARQSENEDMLGMAVSVPKEAFWRLDKSPDEGEGITHSWMMMAKPDANGQLAYQFFAGWEQSNALFAVPEHWTEAVQAEVMKSAGAKVYFIDLVE